MTVFPAFNRCLISFRVMAMIVGTLALMLSDGRAQASCGDYLAGAHGAAESPARRIDAGPLATLPENPLRHGPCRGPNCRNSPEIPPSAPLSIQVDQQQQQGLDPQVAHQNIPPSLAGLIWAADVLSERKHADRLERPPRTW